MPTDINMASKTRKLKVTSIQEAIKSAPQPRSLKRYGDGEIVFALGETKKVVKIETSPQVARHNYFSFKQKIMAKIHEQRKERWAAYESRRLAYEQEILEEDEIIDLEEDLALTDSDAEDENGDEDVKVKEDDEADGEKDEEIEDEMEEEMEEEEEEDEHESEEYKKPKNIEDSEDEAIGIKETKKARKDSKKRVRVYDSDEEDEDTLAMKLAGEDDSNVEEGYEEEEEDEDEEPNEDGLAMINDDSEEEEENKENIDGNGEEDEEEKEVRPSDFFFNEAELSGEGSSDEEEEDGEDELIKELIDEEADKLDGEKIRKDVAKVFHKELENEDKRMLLQLQERYLEDGDLHSDHKRSKKFRWGTASSAWLDNARDSDSSTDEEGGEDEDDDDDENAPVFRLKNPYLNPLSSSENKMALSRPRDSILPKTTLTKPSSSITSYLVRDAHLNDILSTKRSNPFDRNQRIKKLKPESSETKSLFNLLK